jgi:N-acetylglucosaminyldiphosphoundecaprenol N-acetyl-beta-D-mannosaminyltransferase
MACRVTFPHSAERIRNNLAILPLGTTGPYCEASGRAAAIWRDDTFASVPELDGKTLNRYSRWRPAGPHRAGSPLLPTGVTLAGALSLTRKKRTCLTIMQRPKSHLFGIGIDAIDMPQAVEQILAWTRDGNPECRYVVTPNVDHAVLLREHELLQRAYGEADLILADGHPIVWASRLLGKPVPERVPGSDLVPNLFSAVADGETLTVFLLGAAEGVARRAAANMKDRWPNVVTVGTCSPPPGFERDPRECDSILKQIADVHPDVLIVGLGAPKQECWIHEHHQQIRASVALCVGATIDFLAGEKRRAPRWVQRAGLEWAHRMLSEPKRLLRRYARDAWVFPQLVMQQWVSDRRGR